MSNKDRPPTREAVVVGISLFWLPEKEEGGDRLPAANRVLAHILWVDEGGQVREGTVPVMHPYPPGQEVDILEEAVKRYPFGSVLHADDTSGPPRAKSPEKATAREMVDGQIVGWFLRYIPHQDGGPELHPFLAVRRRFVGGFRTAHVRLEEGQAVRQCQPSKTLQEELQEAGHFARWANEAMAGVRAAPGRGGYFQAIPETGPEERPPA